MKRNFPIQPTPFIGREDELTAIARLLADPACRLLTLVGPGGIGKTRLAIQVGLTEGDDFERGAYFINLQPVRSVGHMVSTTADALEIPLAGIEDAQIQLLNYLGDKNVLLVLDNFEHLLDGADFIVQVLQSAPNLKLIVTSREALNLQEEWLYPVESMPYPTMDYPGDISGYGAVQLFAKSVQRVRPDFSLQAERKGVMRICQLVEGMPLALELAASWTKTLDCEEIADEIQRDIEFLITNLRDVPQRHRSIQAVNNQSWRRLDEGERHVFKKLSVFRDGFTRQAARAIAGASLPVLSTLVNKSLLRVEPGVRYQIHELIRQCAEEKLRENPDEVKHTHDLHCAYYTDFLHERLDNILGGYQIEAAAEIEVEIQNIRSAWQWAVNNARVEEIEKSVHTLATFLDFRGRYLEKQEALKKAKVCLDGEGTSEITQIARLKVLLMLSWSHLRIGQLEEAEEAVNELQAAYQRMRIRPIHGDGTDPGIVLGVIASIRGDYPEVARLGEQVLQTSKSQGHLWNQKFAFYLLSSAALAQGEYELARGYACEAYAISREIKDDWFAAYCLKDIGRAAFAMGDYEAAKEYYEDSYTIREKFKDPEGMALALIHLGEVAIQRREYDDAFHNFQRSFDIYREINDKGGLATALCGLGNTALALGDYKKACQQYHEALCIARDIQYMPLMFSLLTGIGDLLIHIGQAERGIELLMLTSEHPASEYEAKEKARQALKQYQESLSPNQIVTATKQAREGNLESVVEALVLELSVLNIPEAVQPRTAAAAKIPKQTLIDPLTDRELEVLALIADGLTNKQIAEELIISIGTTKWYTNKIYSKLGVSNRTQAVVRARELELIV